MWIYHVKCCLITQPGFSVKIHKSAQHVYTLLIWRKEEQNQTVRALQEVSHALKNAFDNGAHSFLITLQRSDSLFM